MRLLTFPVAAGLLLAGCVAFVATAYGGYRSLGELTRQEAGRAHALRTQQQLSDLNGLLIDLETGTRGFLITGDAAFLQPYERAQRDLDASYAQLKDALAVSGDRQDQAFARLDRFIAERRRQVEDQVAKRWKLGAEAMNDRQAYVAGKQLMDETRGDLSGDNPGLRRQIYAAGQG